MAKKLLLCQSIWKLSFHRGLSSLALWPQFLQRTLTLTNYTRMTSMKKSSIGRAEREVLQSGLSLKCSSIEVLVLQQHARSGSSIWFNFVILYQWKSFLASSHFVFLRYLCAAFRESNLRMEHSRTSEQIVPWDGKAIARKETQSQIGIGFCRTWRKEKYDATGSTISHWIWMPGAKASWKQKQ